MKASTKIALFHTAKMLFYVMGGTLLYPIIGWWGLVGLLFILLGLDFQAKADRLKQEKQNDSKYDQKTMIFGRYKS